MYVLELLIILFMVAPAGNWKPKCPSTVGNSQIVSGIFHCNEEEQVIATNWMMEWASLRNMLGGKAGSRGMPPGRSRIWSLEASEVAFAVRGWGSGCMWRRWQVVVSTEGKACVWSVLGFLVLVLAGQVCLTYRNSLSCTLRMCILCYMYTQ